MDLVVFSIATSPVLEPPGPDACGETAVIVTAAGIGGEEGISGTTFDRGDREGVTLKATGLSNQFMGPVGAICIKTNKSPSQKVSLGQGAP